VKYHGTSPWHLSTFEAKPCPTQFKMFDTLEEALIKWLFSTIRGSGWS